MKQIDLNFIGPIDRIHVWTDIPEKTKKSLKHVPEILDRILNSLRFIYLISEDQCPKRLRCARVRAALTELLSIEDVQAKMVTNGILLKVHKMNETGHPLLCIVRELRNYELHISSMEIGMEKKDYLMGSPDPSKGKLISDVPMFYINNISLSEFKKEVRNYKSYNGEQFDYALNWFNDIQKEWGISEILLRAVLQYSSELVSHFQPIFSK